MDDSQFEGISSLVRLSGANVPSRARFVGEAILSGTLSALTVGLVCGQVGATVTTVGPLLPFLLGSWTGYSVGLWRYWDTCRQLTRSYAKRYPSILVHALRTERGVLVPKSVMDASYRETTAYEEAASYNTTTTTNTSNSASAPTLEQWVFDGGLGRLSWCVLAAQSVRNDVEEVERQERQRIMEEYNNNNATNDEE